VEVLAANGAEFDPTFKRTEISEEKAKDGFDAAFGETQ
jgi:hypothetical protein